MNQNEISRRIALRTLLLGAAGAAVAACGGSKESAPTAATPTAEPAATPAPTTEAPAAAPAGAEPAQAAAGTLPPLDPKDPQAVALGYVTDATTLDPAKHPPYQPGRNCANCVQFKGAATDAQAPCGIFAGKSVAAAGWCKVWAPKPA